MQNKKKRERENRQATIHHSETKTETGNVKQDALLHKIKKRKESATFNNRQTVSCRINVLIVITFN